MSKVIGAASEFYRLRVTRIDVTDEPELDWRDDILYRDPPAEVPDEEEDWRLQAVRITDDTSHEIAQFTEQEQAHSLMEAVQEDLDSMTKSAFEDRYLADADATAAPPTPQTVDDSEPEEGDLASWDDDAAEDE
jgi:hypothetical protein